MTTDLVLDTHVVAWLVSGERPISAAAARAIEGAANPSISTFTLYEIGYKAIRKRWDEMHPLIERLRTLLGDAGCTEIPIDGTIAMLAAQLPWDHGDPGDRVIAATALRFGAPLVTQDKPLRRFSNLRTIW